MLDQHGQTLGKSVKNDCLLEFFVWGNLIAIYNIPVFKACFELLVYVWKTSSWLSEYFKYCIPVTFYLSLCILSLNIRQPWIRQSLSSITLDFSELLFIFGRLMCYAIFGSSNTVKISYKHQARCIGIWSFQDETTRSTWPISLTPCVNVVWNQSKSLEASAFWQFVNRSNQKYASGCSQACCSITSTTTS